jgi:hypothetical protein
MSDVLDAVPCGVTQARRKTGRQPERILNVPDFPSNFLARFEFRRRYAEWPALILLAGGGDGVASIFSGRARAVRLGTIFAKKVSS